MYDISLKNNITGMNTTASNVSLRMLLKIIKDFKPDTEEVGIVQGKRTKIVDGSSEESYLIKQLDQVLKSQTKN